MRAVSEAHVGNTTVRAPADLRLVQVDENPRVAEWPSTAIARDCPLVPPSYRLLVDELDRGERSRLQSPGQQMSETKPSVHPGDEVYVPKKVSRVCTWSAIIVCSKRGPTMACALGFWLLLQTPFRFGACIVRISSPASTDSCSALSSAPCADVATSFVAETLGVVLSDPGVWTGVVYPREIARGLRAVNSRTGARELSNAIL